MTGVTIVEFLQARLADDERIAQAAQADDPTPWTAEADDKPRRAGGLPRNYSTSGLLMNGDDEPMWDCEGSNTLCMSGASTIHAARHDPARALAEIEAKTEVLREHYWGMGKVCERCSNDWQTVRTPCRTIRALALPYAGHPDYNESWRP